MKTPAVIALFVSASFALRENQKLFNGVTKKYESFNMADRSIPIVDRIRKAMHLTTAMMPLLEIAKDVQSRMDLPGSSEGAGSDAIDASVSTIESKINQVNGFIPVVENLNARVGVLETAVEAGAIDNLVKSIAEVVDRTTMDAMQS